MSAARRTWPGCALLVAAALALLLLVASSAGAKPSKPPKPAGAAAQAKQIAALETLVGTLSKELTGLESRSAAIAARTPQPLPPAPSPPLPFAGPAGGALTGDFPNPLLASGIVGTAQLAPEAVMSTAVRDDSLTGADVADGLIAPPIVPGATIGAENIPAGAGDGRALATVIEYPLAGDPAGSRTIIPGEGSVVIKLGCPAGTRLLAGGWEWSDQNSDSTLMFESHPAESKENPEEAESTWEWRPKVLSGGTTNTFLPKLLCLLV
jgi:hypothetical protein